MSNPKASFPELADALIHHLHEIRSQTQKPKQKLWVALAGAPGSGKTTLAEGLKNHISNYVEGVRCVVLPMDGFHFYRQELDQFPDPKLAHERRGAEWTFDVNKFVSLLTSAKEQGHGSFPSFDHSVGDPLENDIHITDEVDIVIVEGLYMCLRTDGWEKLAPVFDESWFLNADIDVAMDRVVRRHMQSWNWPEERARERAEKNDRPNGLFVLETIKNASTVVVVGEM